MTEFSKIGLSQSLCDRLEEAGYLVPTPVQLQAIPPILQRQDVIAIAQTGTGKTAAFSLPIMDILAQTRSRARMSRCLILEPTRELASQVLDSFKNLGVNYNFSTALFIGGVDMAPQKKLIQSGVDIIIATPGRLLDLVMRGGLLLNSIDIFVIDEADRMMDMGFIPDIIKIINLLPASRQTLLFSATMPSEIKKLSQNFMKNPKDIIVSRPSTTAETIEQFLILSPKNDKTEYLEELIIQQKIDKCQANSDNSAIIFCNTKIFVNKLTTYLTKKNFSAVALHGDMEQSHRMKNLQKFKDGKCRILICSDVAARGIDIPAVSHVINFDVPHNAEDYVHRIGRTGRAGRKGKAFMLFDKDNLRDFDSLAAIEKLIQKEIDIYGRHQSQEEYKDSRPNIQERSYMPRPPKPKSPVRANLQRNQNAKPMVKPMAKPEPKSRLPKHIQEIHENDAENKIPLPPSIREFKQRKSANSKNSTNRHQPNNRDNPRDKGKILYHEDDLPDFLFRPVSRPRRHQ